MRLYSGSSQAFIRDTIQNEIAEKISKEYENYYGRRVNPSELSAWTNSLQFVKNLIEFNSLSDNMIVIEYELPYTTERIDCILFGKDKEDKDNAVVIELKQWSKVEDCDIENNVITFVGGANRMVPHPSIQVRGYHNYLSDFVEVFHDTNKSQLSSCVYCHNYLRTENSALYNPKFDDILTEFPLFSRQEFEKLGNYLKSKLSKGKGLEIFNRFITII